MWAGDEKVSQIEVMLVEVNLIAIVTVNGFLKDPFFPSVILKKNMKQFSEILLFYEIPQNNSDLNKKKILVAIQTCGHKLVKKYNSACVCHLWRAWG